jgi:hypothetical protein
VHSGGSASLGPRGFPTHRHARPTRVRRVRRHSDVAVHDVTPGALSGIRKQNQFAELIFKFDFLQFSKLKCTLHRIAKWKIIYSSTTSAKAVRGFDHEILHKQHANLGIFSAPVNRSRSCSIAFFTNFHFEFQMPLNSKVVCLAKLHMFHIGWF